MEEADEADEDEGEKEEKCGGSRIRGSRIISSISEF